MSASHVTVDDLVGHPQLFVRLVAGKRGGERRVDWAQSCELPRPWEWIGEGILLLTAGSSFPASPEDQIEYLHALNDAGIPGMVLGEDMTAPLTPEASREADEIAFPVLLADYEVPYVLISRTIADLNTSQSSHQIRRLVRLYNHLREIVSGDIDTRSLMKLLERESDSVLLVVARDSGDVVIEGRTRLDPEAAGEVMASLSRGSRLPAYSRIETPQGRVTVIPLGRGARFVLLALPARTDSALDLVLLEHVATILTAEVQRRELRAHSMRDLGHTTVEQLKSGRATSEQVAGWFELAGLTEPPWRFATWHASTGPAIEQAQWRLAREETPYLVSEKGREITLVTGGFDIDEMLQTFESENGSLIAGTSEPFSRFREAADALRESQWAVQAAASSGRGVVRFSRASSPLLPRTPGEARFLVQRVLGNLINYDDAHRSELVSTLTAYFDHNRSTHDSAEFLRIHRQTLAYRLKRIEEITGKRLGEMAEQTELYLAVTALPFLPGARRRDLVQKDE